MSRVGNPASRQCSGDCHGGCSSVGQSAWLWLRRSIPLDFLLWVWYPWCSGSAREIVALQVPDRNREGTPVPQKKTVPKICEECGARFLVTETTDRRGNGRFCSRSCAGKEKARKYLPIGKYGSDNPGWKGGLTKSSRGYWYVRFPTHPRALKSGYVKRADLVLEKKLGRPLQEGEITHHIDGNKENDSPDNLESCPGHREHASKHPRARKPPKPKNPFHPNNRRYLWPSDKELLSMREGMTLRAIAKVIGCNHKVVDRRLKRIKKHLCK